MSLNHKTVSELRNVEQHFSLKADHVGIVFMLRLLRDLFQSYTFFLLHSSGSKHIFWWRINKFIGKYVS